MNLKWIEKTLSIPLLIACTALLFQWFLCAYVVDLTDEAYGIVGGWKLLPGGEKPFSYEMYNAPRQYDLLNYLMIQPWVPYSVLTIRRVSMLLYGLQLGLLTFFAFRRSPMLSAGLAFWICLTLNSVTLPFNYNIWARGMLLLHQLTILIALTAARNPRPWFYGAGFFLGIGTIAYAPMILPFAVGFFTLLFFPVRKWILSYLVGFGTPLLALLAYFFLNPTLGQKWLLDLHQLSNLSDYARESPLEKLLGLFHWILHTPEFFWGIPFFLCLTSTRKNKLVSLFPFVFLGHLAWRFFFISNGDETLRTWAGVSSAMLVTLLYRQRKEFAPELWILCAVGFSGLVMFTLASASGIFSTGWALPALFLPLVAKVNQMPLNPTAKPIYYVLLIALGVGGFQASTRFPYGEIPLSEMSATVSVSPLKGLKTSPRRAEILKTIEPHLKNTKYVMAYPWTAGMHYFGEARSSLKTLAVQPHLTTESYLESLRWMDEQHRHPGVIVRLRQTAWNWGLRTGAPISFSADHPYSRYATCVATRVLVDFPEVEVLEANPRKGPLCVTNLFSDRLTTHN